MRVLLAAFMILSAWSPQLLADEPSLGPAIEGYGPTFPINDRDVPLEKGAGYKAVFDLGAYSNDLASLNYRLVSVARYLNMHARNGVLWGRRSLFQTRRSIAVPVLQMGHGQTHKPSG